jgi:putative membrane protein
MSLCPPAKRSIRDYLYITFCGMCMGAADIVPGISGGTIAFIMGFYKELLTSIKSLTLKNFFSNSSTKFLLFLFSGISFSLIMLAPLFDRILNQEVSRMFLYSGFLGLILASIVLCFKEIKNWRTTLFLALITGVLLAFILTSVDLKPIKDGNFYDLQIPFATEKTIANYDHETKTLQNVSETTIVAMVAKGVIEKDAVVYNSSENISVIADSLIASNRSMIDLWLVFCGSIAVCALLLPGISGSYLLTILGSYAVVISALADFIQSAKQLTFDSEAFIILGSLSVGILAGAVVFSRTVLYLLKHYHDLTIALMAGFMIGALGTVWPFWSYTYFLNPLKLNKGPLLNPEYPVLPPLDSSLIPCLLLTISGFALVFLVEYLAKRTRAHPSLIQESV